MIKHIDSFEDIAAAKLYMDGMIARIRKIENNEGVCALGIESIITAMELLEPLKDSMLYDSVAQVLHITVRIFEAQYKYNEANVVAGYVADHHDKYLDKYIKHLTKQMLKETTKGGKYVN